MKGLTIGGVAVLPGESKKIDLPVVRLYTDTEIKMPVYVKRSRKDGPVIFVSAAVHGDELNGVEIIRRLIRRRSLKLKKGTLIFVPMVNVYGVLNQSRLLYGQGMYGTAAIKQVTSTLNTSYWNDMNDFTTEHIE